MADGNLARELDRADQEIDAFIAKRAAEREAEREAANEEDRELADSKRRYAAARAAGHRAEWLDFHRRQAVLFETLAAEHRSALGELIDAAASSRGGEGVS